MMKKAFVFPGQGAQKVGMVKDLYDAYPIVKQLFEEADDALGFSLTKLCFEGPDEELMPIIHSRPSLRPARPAAVYWLRKAFCLTSQPVTASVNIRPSLPPVP